MNADIAALSICPSAAPTLAALAASLSVVENAPVQIWRLLLAGHHARRLLAERGHEGIVVSERRSGPLGLVGRQPRPRQRLKIWRQNGPMLDRADHHRLASSRRGPRGRSRTGGRRAPPPPAASRERQQARPQDEPARRIEREADLDPLGVADQRQHHPHRFVDRVVGRHQGIPRRLQLAHLVEERGDRALDVGPVRAGDRLGEERRPSRRRRSRAAPPAPASSRAPSRRPRHRGPPRSPRGRPSPATCRRRWPTSSAARWS